MKRFALIFGAMLALLLLCLVALPFVFKDEIFQRVKAEASANLNANIAFGEVDVSILQSFPDLTLTVNDVRVSGKGAFEGVVLADIGALQITVDVMSVVRGQTMEIESFVLGSPKVHVIVMPNGDANYDITLPSDPKTSNEETAGEEASFSVALSRYAIEGASLIYDDRQSDLYVEMQGLDHSGEGGFTQDVFDLKMVTRIAALTVKTGGVVYLNKTEIEAHTDLRIDAPASRYTFRDNNLRLNGLVLGFDGWLAMPDEVIDMDLSFEAKQTSFSQILSLVPAAYAADLADIKSTGELALKGTAKGVYLDETLPAFHLALSVTDATFQYPDLPDAARDIQMDVRIDNPGGSADATVVDVKRCHMELGANPIDLRIRTSTPVSDPDIDAEIKMQLDLASLKQVIPMADGEEYTGKITSDLSLKGRLSAIDAERYEDFFAAGSLNISDMRYKSAELPYATTIHRADFKLTPAFVELSNVDAELGKSDVQLSGKVSNYLAYYFRDEPLEGALAMTSKRLDLNELAGADSQASGGAGQAGSVDEAPTEVLIVPSNLSMGMTATIGTLLYDNLQMRQATVGLRLQGGEAVLDQFKTEMLGGTMAVSGLYSTQDPTMPRVDFGLDITRFDLPQTYASFATVQKLAPVIETASGAFSSRMRFNTTLDPNMEPVLSTLAGEGRLTTHDVLVRASGALDKLADRLKLEDLRTLSLNKVDIVYAFVDGRVEVAPFDLKLGDTQLNVSGSHGLDQTLDYTLRMDVPTAALGEASALSDQLGAVGAKAPSRVTADVHVGGTVSAPKIEVSMRGAVDAAKDQIKEAVGKQIEAAKEQVMAQVAETREEVEARLKQEADKIRKEANKQAQAVRDQATKAADLAKKTGYASADELVNQAHNPAAKMAANEAAKKAKKDADDKAKQIVAQGDRQAQDILNAAEKKIQGLK